MHRPRTESELSDTEKDDNVGGSAGGTKAGKSAADTDSDWSSSDNEDDGAKRPAPPPPVAHMSIATPHDDGNNEQHADDGSSMISGSWRFTATVHALNSPEQGAVDDLTGAVLVRPPSLHSSFRRATNTSKRLPSRKRASAIADAGTDVFGDVPTMTLVNDDDPAPTSPTKQVTPPAVKPKPKPKPKPSSSQA